MGRSLSVLFRLLYCFVLLVASGAHKLRSRTFLAIATAICFVPSFLRNALHLARSFPLSLYTAHTCILLPVFIYAASIVVIHRDNKHRVASRRCSGLDATIYPSLYLHFAIFAISVISAISSIFIQPRVATMRITFSELRTASTAFTYLPCVTFFLSQLSTPPFVCAFFFVAQFLSSHTVHIH